MSSFLRAHLTGTRRLGGSDSSSVESEIGCEAASRAGARGSFRLRAAVGAGAVVKGESQHSRCSEIWARQKIADSRAPAEDLQLGKPGARCRGADRSHGQEQRRGGHGGSEIDVCRRSIVDESAKRDRRAIAEGENSAGDLVREVRAIVEDDLGDVDGGRPSESECCSNSRARSPLRRRKTRLAMLGVENERKRRTSSQ